MKRGLLLLSKPYMLIQFFYLYTQSKEYEYDVIIESLANADLIDDLFQKCRSLNLFKSVKVSRNTFQHQKSSRLARLFVKLLGLAVLRKQENFYNELFDNDRIKLDDYSRIIVQNDFSFISSALINVCAYNKEVIMLEDGTIDYLAKYRHMQLKDMCKIHEWIAFFLAKMNYANINYHYANKMFCYITKYSTLPEQLRYRKYKEIKKLFDFHGNEKADYLNLVTQIYKLNVNSLKSIDAIIFTAPFTADYCRGDRWFSKCSHWLQTELASKKVLLKKHPRDTFIYSIPNTDVCEMYAELPGELLMSELENVEIIFMSPSSILLNVINQNLKYKIMFFESVHNAIYQKRFWEYCELLHISSENIVQV